MWLEWVCYLDEVPNVGRIAGNDLPLMPMLPNSLQRYAWLSIFTALATILLKSLAWWLTGSVGLLSDALESVVNLAGALMALAMLTLAAMPADVKHPYGHGKAEYFSSAFEGLLIVLAAISISLCSHCSSAESASTGRYWNWPARVSSRLCPQPGNSSDTVERGSSPSFD